MYICLYLMKYATQQSVFTSLNKKKQKIHKKIQNEGLK